MIPSLLSNLLLLFSDIIIKDRSRCLRADELISELPGLLLELCLDQILEDLFGLSIVLSSLGFLLRSLVHVNWVDLEPKLRVRGLCVGDGVLEGLLVLNNDPLVTVVIAKLAVVLVQVVSDCKLPSLLNQHRVAVSVCFLLELLGALDSGVEAQFDFLLTSGFVAVVVCSSFDHCECVVDCLCL